MATGFANTFSAPPTFQQAFGTSQAAGVARNPILNQSGYVPQGQVAPAAQPSSSSSFGVVPQYQNDPSIPTSPVVGVKSPTNPSLTSSPSTDLWYNGQHYTDQNAYQNAVVADVNQAHTQTVKQIQTAYQQGLISFDQQQKLVDQSRGNLKTQTDQALQALDASNQAAKDSQQAHFSAADANAVSSRQGELADQTAGQYGQSVGNVNAQAAQGNAALDASAQGLQQSRGNFDTSYQNQLTAADQAQTQGADAVRNAGIQFQNQVKSVQASNANSAAPTVTQYDPGTLANQISSYVVNSGATNADSSPGGISTGINNAFANAANQLTQMGVDPNSGGGKAILSYLQAQFNDPKSALYSQYVNKAPVSSISTALGG